MPTVHALRTTQCEFPLHINHGLRLIYLRNSARKIRLRSFVGSAGRRLLELSRQPSPVCFDSDSVSMRVTMCSASCRLGTFLLSAFLSPLLCERGAGWCWLVLARCGAVRAAVFGPHTPRSALRPREIQLVSQRRAVRSGGSPWAPRSRTRIAGRAGGGRGRATESRA